MQRAITRWTQYLFVVALVTSPRLSPCAPLQADTSASQLVIRADGSGLLSALTHDHQFTPARWQAEVDFDPDRPQEVRVDVRIDATTLHDHVARLSQRTRDHVDRKTAGPEVLDAERYREIRFHGESASARDEGDGLQGVLHGALSLHGTTRPLDIPFHARADGPGYRVSGSVRFRQTDYGMTPFSTARGTIGVDDEIQVDFDLVLVRASGAAGSVSRLETR
jgi:polyisoprenoid-binding protein YceI